MALSSDSERVMELMPPSMFPSTAASRPSKSSGRIRRPLWCSKASMPLSDELARRKLALRWTRSTARRPPRAPTSHGTLLGRGRPSQRRGARLSAAVLLPPARHLVCRPQTQLATLAAATTRTPRCPAVGRAAAASAGDWPAAAAPAGDLDLDLLLLLHILWLR